MKAMQRFPAAAIFVVVWAVAPAPALGQIQQAAPGAPSAGTVSTRAPAAAQRVRLSGLPNFGRISKQLSRGGQPNTAGFGELKKLGVEIVVNLGHEPGEIARERALVERQGMQYVSIPWRGSKNPDTRQIAEFLDLLRANPGKQMFVHCRRGAERTGVMVACYRMSADHWTAEQALDEMEQFGFRGLRFGHLKKFVREFPFLLLNDPALKNLGLGR